MTFLSHPPHFWEEVKWQHSKFKLRLRSPIQAIWVGRLQRATRVRRSWLTWRTVRRSRLSHRLHSRFRFSRSRSLFSPLLRRIGRGGGVSLRLGHSESSFSATGLRQLRVRITSRASERLFRFSRSRSRSSSMALIRARISFGVSFVKSSAGVGIGWR